MQTDFDVGNRSRSIFSSHIEPDLNDEPHIYQELGGEDDTTIEGYTAQAAGSGTRLYGAASPQASNVDSQIDDTSDEAMNELIDKLSGAAGDLVERYVRRQHLQFLMSRDNVKVDQ